MAVRVDQVCVTRQWMETCGVYLFMGQMLLHSFFFFQAEDGIRDYKVTGVQTCALPISGGERARRGKPSRKVLDALLGDPYFAAPPPKSTGRERFGPDYAARLLDDVKQTDRKSVV